MRLNQVTVPCLDVAKSIPFYRALGMRLIVHSGPDYARFELPDTSTFSLHRVDALAQGEGAWVYFEYDDADALDAAHLRARSRGLNFEQAPTDMRWLWREAHLRDPDGNKIILFFAGEHRRFPPWRLPTDATSRR